MTEALADVVLAAEAGDDPDELGLEPDPEVVGQVTDRDEPQRRQPIERADPAQVSADLAMMPRAGAEAMPPTLPSRSSGHRSSSPIAALTDGSVSRLLTALLERPAEHLAAEPPKLANAWTKVEEAVSAALAGLVEVQQVANGQHQAWGAHMASVQESARAGTAMPTVPADWRTSADWAAAQAHAAAVARGKVQRAQAARAAYDALAAKLLTQPSRLAELTDALVSEHHKALAAVQSAQEAVTKADAAYRATLAHARAAGLDPIPFN